jgi:CRP/FNR family cyclic AMP-dependent transcriptional regulator
MADDLEALRALPLFSVMKERDLRKVQEISKRVRHDPGHVVVEQDQSAIGFHLVLEGAAEASIGGKVVGVLEPGDYFGEMSLIDGKPRSATVRATTELVTLVIPSWNFNQILDSHPEMMRALLVELAARLRKVEALRG